MISELYILCSDVENYSSFIQNIREKEKSIMSIASSSNWKPIGDKYKEIEVELSSSDTGKRNYKMDISGSLQPFFIFSDLAIKSLEEILLPRGEVLPIQHKSKRKKFYGYHPTKTMYDCLDREKSIYRECLNGLIIEKPVLIKKYITDEYLFSIKEDTHLVFVTDKFKKEVEKNCLQGFDFSNRIELS